MKRDRSSMKPLFWKEARGVGTTNVQIVASNVEVIAATLALINSSRFIIIYIDRVSDNITIPRSTLKIKNEHK